MRWTTGERLHEVVAAQAARAPKRVAVDLGDGAPVTYGALMDLAAVLAARMVASGVRPGDRVGLMFDRQVEAYTTLLAVSMVDATFVPLDASFPTERLAFIAADAELSAIITAETFVERIAPLHLPLLLADRAEPAPHVGAPPRSEEPDPLAYIIYTSGTTGMPKGVAVAHSSICNFVRVAADVYRLEPDDRMSRG